MFKNFQAFLGGSALCVKPIADGCSTGVARLSCARDLVTYATAVQDQAECIAAGELSEGHSRVEMPAGVPSAFLLEPFIDTDPVLIVEGDQGEALQVRE